MATVTKENIQVLADLQLRDSVIDKLKNRLAKIPDEIAQLRITAQSEAAGVEAAKGETKKAQVEKKNKEVELGSKEDLINKHQKDLNAVKSNDAFKALQKEIDNEKSEKSKLEEDVLVLMDRIDELVKKEKEEGKKAEAHKGEIEGLVKKLEADGEAIKKEIEAKSAEREAAAAGVPAEILKRYDQIRSRKQGVALVPLKGNICGGCNLTMTPQTLVNVKKGNELVVCEGCQRILFAPTPSQA